MGRLVRAAALLAVLSWPASSLQVLQNSADESTVDVAGVDDGGDADEMLLEVSSAAHEAPAASRPQARTRDVGTGDVTATAAHSPLPVTTAAPAATAMVGGASAEDQAFLTVRRQLAQEQSGQSELRRQLDAAVAWGNSISQRLASSEQSRQSSIDKALEARSREAAAAAAAAAARETDLRRQLNASEAEVRRLTTDLAAAQQRLSTVGSELAVAKKAAAAQKTALLQDSDDAKRQLASRDATIAWLKARQQSKESDLGAENVKLRGLLQKVVVRLKDDRSVKKSLRNRLKQEQQKAKIRETDLQHQIDKQATQLQDEGRREEQLRRELTALEHKAFAPNNALIIGFSAHAAAASPSVAVSQADADDVVEIPE